VADLAAGRRLPWEQNWSNLEALDIEVSIDSPADVCAGGRA